MSVMRKALLAASTNPWLRDHVTKWGFVRKSVTRFMPGEQIEDALQAAREQQKLGINTILTRLGENLTKAEEFEEVTQHYLDVLDKVKAAGLDAHISIKPTQLGLDLDRALCERNIDRLVERAERARQLRVDRHGGLAVRRSDASSSSSAREPRARASASRFRPTSSGRRKTSRP